MMQKIGCLEQAPILFIHLMIFFTVFKSYSFIRLNKQQNKKALVIFCDNLQSMIEVMMKKKLKMK